MYGEINSCFCSKTQRQMFGHVGTHLDGHQYGFTIQISKILVKKLLPISGIRKIAVTWILARVFTFFPSPDYGLYLVFLPSVGILNLVMFIRIFISHCLPTLVLKSPNGEWPTTYTFFHLLNGFDYHFDPSWMAWHRKPTIKMKTKSLRSIPRPKTM